MARTLRSFVDLERILPYTPTSTMKASYVTLVILLDISFRLQEAHFLGEGVHFGVKKAKDLISLR